MRWMNRHVGEAGLLEVEPRAVATGRSAREPYHLQGRYFPRTRRRMNTDTLVRPLWPDPIDLVGDVHGERQTLERLLDHLGYDEAGRHPQDRRLVFLGDLVDRGPDSPGVVRRVRDLVEAGRAQCILGNHEFNILKGSVKADNHWFF